MRMRQREIGRQAHWDGVGMNDTAFSSSRRKAKVKVHKDWRFIVAAAESADWRIRPSRGKEGYLVYPDNTSLAPIAVPSTPSSGKRAIQNKVSELRRAGLAV